jgi:thiol-disulfide isomerase/thioredoxin
MLLKNINSFEEYLEIIDKYTNVIVNIGASWCKPCNAIKPLIEKYIKVINENDFIYIKLDHSIYELDDRFYNTFKMKKIPYFGFVTNKELVETFVSGDFMVVSKKIFDFIKKIKGNVIIEENNNDIKFDKSDDF